MKHGFVRVAAAVPQLKVADCQYNAEQVIKMIKEVAGSGTDILLFPELSLTGSTCGELFYNRTLLKGARAALNVVVDATRGLPFVVVVGVPFLKDGRVCSGAAVIYRGELLQITEGGDTVFTTPEFSFGVEMGDEAHQVLPVSVRMAANGADIVLGLDSSPMIVGGYDAKRQSLKELSARISVGYVYVNAGFGESTTSAAYVGATMVVESGKVVAEGVSSDLKSFITITEIDVDKLRSERIRKSDLWNSVEYLKGGVDECFIDHSVNDDFNLTRRFAKNPFIPEDPCTLNVRCREIFDIQTAALAKRLVHTGSRCAVIGISGGLDSTLALLVAVKTFDRLNIDRKGVIGITMPGFGTTGRTYNNALELMRSLGISIKEISIKEACELHFRAIGHDGQTHDVTYENSQARERTQILMDYANLCGGLVIGTGDMSELALGWATYNGDHMSMYGVNGGVPKTLVKSLVAWVAKEEMDAQTAATLLDIVDTPISPELIPANENGSIKQKTEDLVGPYELHDFFLFHFIRNGYAPDKIYDLAKTVFNGEYENSEIYKWLRVFFRRFFAQQFKRNCLPDGPAIGSVVLKSNIPSDAVSAEWLKIIDAIEE